MKFEIFRSKVNCVMSICAIIMTMSDNVNEAYIQLEQSGYGFCCQLHIKNKCFIGVHCIMDDCQNLAQIDFGNVMPLHGIGDSMNPGDCCVFFYFLSFSFFSLL